MEEKTKAAGMTKEDQLKALYNECGLVKQDVHKHAHYLIITRTGIEKIQYAKNIHVHFDIVRCEMDFCTIKATGTMKVGDTVEVQETYGSAYAATCQNKYYVEMAEKRALSRIVLKMTKAYSLGVFGEDEADAFKKNETNE